MMLCLVVVLLLASDPPKPEKPPVMPIEAQVDYFADLVQVTAAQAALQKSSDALQKACGDKFHPEVQGKRIACVANKSEAK